MRELWVLSCWQVVWGCWLGRTTVLSWRLSCPPAAVPGAGRWVLSNRTRCWNQNAFHLRSESSSSSVGFSWASAASGPALPHVPLPSCPGPQHLS